MDKTESLDMVSWLKGEKKPEKMHPTGTWSSSMSCPGLGTNMEMIDEFLLNSFCTTW
jgi:hypothetical protein